MKVDGDINEQESAYLELVHRINDCDRKFLKAFSQVRDQESAENMLKATREVVTEFDRILNEFDDLPELKMPESENYAELLKDELIDPLNIEPMALADPTRAKVLKAYETYASKSLEVQMKFGLGLTQDPETRPRSDENDR